MRFRFSTFLPLFLGDLLFIFLLIIRSFFSIHVSDLLLEVFSGSVIMITSSDPPAQVVGFLKSKTPRLNGVLSGRYWMTEQGHIAAQVPLSWQHVTIKEFSLFLKIVNL